jgi:hypothetical protein
MPAYSVFEPAMRRHDAVKRADRFFFVRERFSFAAFLFGPLWMIWRRLWLVLVIYVLVVGLLEYGLSRLGVPAGSHAAVFVLVQFLIGLEAAGLQRWTLVRRGWRDCGTVIADDLELAERRFFDARCASEAAARAGGPRAHVEPSATGFVPPGWAKGVP